MLQLLLLLAIILVVLISVIILPLFFSCRYSLSSEYNDDDNFLLKSSFSTYIYSFEFKRYYQNKEPLNSYTVEFLNFKKEIISERADKSASAEKNSEKFSEKIDKDKKKDEKKSIKELKNNLNISLDILDREMIKKIFSLIYDIFNEIKAEKIKLRLKIYFSDPYYAGITTALYQTLKSQYELKDILLEISWIETQPELDLNISGNLIPLKLFYIILNFIFSAKTIKILFKIYKINRSKK